VHVANWQARNRTADGSQELVVAAVERGEAVRDSRQSAAVGLEGRQSGGCLEEQSLELVRFTLV
jgi:hypothetical protein